MNMKKLVVLVTLCVAMVTYPESRVFKTLMDSVAKKGTPAVVDLVDDYDSGSLVRLAHKAKGAAIQDGMDLEKAANEFTRVVQDQVRSYYKKSPKGKTVPAGEQQADVNLVKDIADKAFAVKAQPKRSSYRTYVDEIVTRELQLNDLRIAEEEYAADTIAQAAKKEAIKMKLNMKAAADEVIDAMRERMTALNPSVGKNYGGSLTKEQFNKRMNKVSKTVNSIFFSKRS